MTRALALVPIAALAVLAACAPEPVAKESVVTCFDGPRAGGLTPALPLEGLVVLRVYGERAADGFRTVAKQSGWDAGDTSCTQGSGGTCDALYAVTATGVEPLCPPDPIDSLHRGLECRQVVVAMGRGHVTVLRSHRDVIDALGLVDTPDEAAFLARLSGNSVRCAIVADPRPEDAVRMRATPDAHEIPLSRQVGCQCPTDYEDYVVRVTRAGEVSERVEGHHQVECPPKGPRDTCVSGS